MYDDIMDRFVPEVKLRDYLKTADLDAYDVAEIIYNAPSPIEEKRAALRQLGALNVACSNEYSESWKNLGSVIDEAINLLHRESSIFQLYECTLYKDAEYSDEYEVGMFQTYEAAIRCIKEREKALNLDDIESVWYQIELWVKEDNDKYINACCYYIINQILCYVETSSDWDPEKDEGCVDGELNIPVCYRPGDILMASGYPFNRGAKFVIIDIGDNVDCCCVQALSKKANGNYSVGAVKHGMIGEFSYPRISALYTAKEYELDMLDEEDSLFAKVKNAIYDNDQKGHKLLDLFFVNEGHEGLTADEVTQLIERI